MLLSLVVGVWELKGGKEKEGVLRDLVERHRVAGRRQVLGIGGAQYRALRCCQLF